MNRKLVAYTKCKTWGHRFDATPGLPTSVEFGFVLRCDRCATVKHLELYRNTGQVYSTRYEYPADYRDLGVKLTKGELRLAEIKARKARRR